MILKRTMRLDMNDLCRVVRPMWVLSVIESIGPADHILCGRSAIGWLSTTRDLLAVPFDGREAQKPHSVVEDLPGASVER